MTPEQADHWLRAPRPVPSPRIRVVCLPYAGGGATVYFKWAAQLPEDVEVRAAQLPARQDRLAEAPLLRLPAIVDRLMEALRALPPAPLVLYGHSLGALVGFELARSLQATGAPPLALIAGARGGPQLPSPYPPLRHVSEPAFLQAMHTRYGTPWAILNNEDLMALALPSLRADMEVFETYAYAPGPPLSFPVLVLRGLKDAGVSAEGARAWSEVAPALEVREVEGGHFFVDSHPGWVIAQVKERLSAPSSA